MKLLIAFFFCLLTLPAADSPSATRATIPSGAVKAADGSYRYTDPQGKKWIYRSTPFGIARAEDMSAAGAGDSDRYADVKAAEDGDFIRFERPTPFGAYRWRQKKTELNEMEQAVWNREKARTAARQD